MDQKLIWIILGLVVVGLAVWQFAPIKGQIVYDPSKPGMLVPEPDVCGRGTGLCYAIPYGDNDPFLGQFTAPNAYIPVGNTIASDIINRLNANVGTFQAQLAANNVAAGNNCEVKVEGNWYRGTFELAPDAEKYLCHSDGAGGTVCNQYFTAGSSNNPYYYLKPYKCVALNAPQPSGTYIIYVHILPTGGMWCLNDADTDCNGLIVKAELLGYLQKYINGQTSKQELLNALQAWINAGGQ